jgi:hypothetical protein
MLDLAPLGRLIDLIQMSLGLIDLIQMSLGLIYTKITYI